MAGHEHHTTIPPILNEHMKTIQVIYNTNNIQEQGKGSFLMEVKTVFQYRHIRVILNDHGLFNSRATL